MMFRVLSLRHIRIPTAGSGELMVLKIAEWIGQARSFLLDVQSEAKRVTWLNFRNTLAQTAVALVFVFFVAVYLGLVDLGLSHLINYLLNIRF